DMVLDRLRGRYEPGGDLSVGQSFSQQEQHLELARGEPDGIGLSRRTRSPCVGTSQLPPHDLTGLGRSQPLQNAQCFSLGRLVAFGQGKRWLIGAAELARGSARGAPVTGDLESKWRGSLRRRFMQATATPQPDRHPTLIP